MYTVVNDFTCVSIVYKYLCINGLYTAAKQRGDFFRMVMEESLQFVFLCIFSLFLGPESSLRGPSPPVSVGSVCEDEKAYFPGSPGSETGLWSPNIPELLGASGSEACRPEGNLGGCLCCCSTESAVSLCSVCSSPSSSPAKLSSGRVSLWTRTGEGSLDVFGACSEPGLCRETVGHQETVRQISQT